MNPDHVWKAACAIGAAIGGIFLGRKISDERHKPAYEQQRNRAVAINKMAVKKRTA